LDSGLTSPLVNVGARIETIVQAGVSLKSWPWLVSCTEALH
jgi:hypothetical protein